MDIHDDCITHPERWDAHGLDDQRLQRVAQVQEYLKQGLLTPGMRSAATPRRAHAGCIVHSTLADRLLRRHNLEAPSRRADPVTRWEQHNLVH